MLRDRAGDLWVRGPRHLYVLPRGDARFLARDRDLPPSSNTALGLAEDRQGRLLVSTDRGLARRIDGRWELTGIAQGLQSEAVTSILEDREGSVWLGLWGSGLARWPGPDEWTNWTTADGLGSDTVWAVLRDPSGTVWLGTDHGLVRLQDHKPPQILTTRNGLGGDQVKSLVDRARRRHLGRLFARRRLAHRSEGRPGSALMPRPPACKTIAPSPCTSTSKTGSGPAPAKACFAAIRWNRICASNASCRRVPLRKPCSFASSPTARAAYG
jgi:ligand-binding sensor domain-containing protein